MNFLAHMHLSCGDPALMVGNYLGDFLKNQEVDQLPMDLQKGVFLHRAIDDYTDNHPEVRACNQLFYSSQGKYSPVITDILFDHILYLEWKRYHQSDFNTFQNMVYETILNKLEFFPERIRPVAVNMCHGKFLNAYKSLEGVQSVFRRVNRRASFENNMENATMDYERNEKVMIERFNNFFPEAIKFVDKFCGC